MEKLVSTFPSLWRFSRLIWFIWLFMVVHEAFPFSVRGLKRVFLRRDNALKLLPFWNSVLSFSSALLERDLSVSKDSGDENVPKTVPKRVSAETWKQNVRRGGFIKQASLDLNGYCKAHRVQEADALFHKMLDAGLDPDMTLYNTLVRGYCRDGNIQDACRVITLMAKHGLIPNDATYWGLVFGFDKYGVENTAVNAFIKIISDIT